MVTPPVDVGTWVSSDAYLVPPKRTGFTGQVIGDLGEGMVRIDLGRSELTARIDDLRPATAPERAAAEALWARIDAERTTPPPAPALTG